MTPPAQPRPFEVRVPLRIQGYDIDFGGVVSNIVYVRWLEDLRLAVLDTYFPFEPQLAEGYAPAILETHIQYKRPLRILDRPVGHMWVSDLGPLRWQVTAEFLVGDQVAATAQQTGLFVQLDSWRPRRVPDELRRRYAAYFVEPASADVSTEE